MAGKIIKITKTTKTKIRAQAPEVPQQAGANLKTGRTKANDLEDLVMLTCPQLVPVTSTGSMGSLLGSVETAIAVPGGTMNRHALDTTEILMQVLQKKQIEDPTSLTNK